MSYDPKNTQKPMTDQSNKGRTTDKSHSGQEQQQRKDKDLGHADNRSNPNKTSTTGSGSFSGKKSY